jgi:hypothetical protein
MRPSNANIAFWLIWLLLVLYCYIYSYDDPSSIFYRSEEAFTQRYSRTRSLEADSFLLDLQSSKATRVKNQAGTSTKNYLCIGIPSLSRATEDFLPRTLASLSDTLTADEREMIRIVVLLANKPPSSHSAYGTRWLEQLADEIIVYEPSNGVISEQIPENPYHNISFEVQNAGQPRGSSRVENMRLDHSVLVESCRASESLYFALVEDDVITSRDWFRRLKRGLQHVERQSRLAERDWVYLRLFYSELFMGWNSEEWLRYSQRIIAVYSVAFVLFIYLRTRKALRQKLTGVAPAYIPALIFGLWLPALILLYFMTGRIAAARLNPFRPWSAGVREMPRYGCCAQGLVFPERRLAGLQKLFRDPPYDFAGDMMLEGYADEHHWIKWALEPSVLQHLGLKQSSEGTRRAEVWNFSFERLE